MPKYVDGAIVIYRVSSSCTPMTPLEVELHIEQHRMPQEIAPKYKGDFQAVRRAFSKQAGAFRKAGWFVGEIKGASEGEKRLMWGIMRLTEDAKAERLDGDFEDRMKWEEDSPGRIQGMHKVAADLDEAYQDVRGKILAVDWTETLRDYLRNHCQAVAIANVGGSYWIPPDYLGKVQEFEVFLEKVGVHLIILEVGWEYVPVIQEAAKDGLEQDIERIRKDIKALTDTSKASAWETQLGEIEQARGKALLCTEVLKVYLGDLLDDLASLEREAVKRHGARKGIVVRRDGSVKRARKGDAQTVPQPPPQVVDEDEELVLLEEEEDDIPAVAVPESLAAAESRGDMASLLAQMEQVAGDPEALRALIMSGRFGQ